MTALTEIYLHELVRSQLNEVRFEALFHHLVTIRAVEDVDTREYRNRGLLPVLVQYGGRRQRQFLKTTSIPQKHWVKVKFSLYKP
jgi:hypothetical protein